MKLAALLFLVTMMVNLPVGKVGESYTSTVGANYSGCTYDPEARTNPGMQRGLPPGLTVSNNGTVSGTPTMAGFYEGVVSCGDKSVHVRIRILK